MTRQYEGYTQLFEGSMSPQAIQLRNVAATPAARSPSRADVLDSLMPLSRNPWSNTPTLINNDRPRPKHQEH
ncbi:hypothetical protein BGX33_007852 [Mortierella sp. NVP41]|nr:hypothetical protein BGX33_007852 [Mortierella sp. NVP41]